MAGVALAWLWCVPNVFEAEGSLLFTKWMASDIIIIGRDIWVKIYWAKICLPQRLGKPPVLKMD